MAKQRAPKTIDEANTFLEGMLRRDESFHLTMDLSVSLYSSRVSRGESFSLHWFDRTGKFNDFRSHSIELLLQEFIAWKALADAPSKPLPPAKANISARPIRRLEHNPVVPLWGEDPTL